MLKIITDDQIPLIHELFHRYAQIKFVPGEFITHDLLHDADILFVRSITPITKKLLEDTPIKIVASATAGIDHIDKNCLSMTPIKFYYAPGCNAHAVVEYVLCCLAACQRLFLLPEKNIRAGVIGVGEIGQRVVDCLQKLGCEVLVNDPPRTKLDPHWNSDQLENFYDLDFISIHTPLTRDDEFPTYHLIDGNFLRHIRQHCVLLNTGRGAVINNSEWSKCSEDYACIDVWENEPNINVRLLERATIATPHIAGYSKPAKYRATLMLYQQIREQLNLPPLSNKYQLEVAQVNTPLKFFERKNWREIALSTYDPYLHTLSMRRHILSSKNAAKAFLQFRKTYEWRDEFMH